MHAMRFDVAAHGPKLGFDIGDRRQLAKAAFGLAARGGSSLATRDQAALRLGERGGARGFAARLALSLGMQLARGGGRALLLAPIGARIGFGLRGGADL